MTDGTVCGRITVHYETNKPCGETPGKEKTMPRIGCHLSSAKGFAAMGRQASDLGADTFQCFLRNPRGSRAKAIDAADTAALSAYLSEHRFAPVIAHAPYIMNLCGASEENRSFAREIFADDPRRLEYIPGQLYNFHPGSHAGQGVEAVEVQEIRGSMKSM